jgi:rhamnogalacturonyl hydrolase YesR
MVPPILAYHGVANNDIATARESVRQCELYSEILCTSTGLWRHIANGTTAHEHEKTDPRAWSTSNAWAAAGIARVACTLRNSVFAAQTTTEQASLTKMVKGIFDATIRADTHPEQLLRNYLDDETAFAEVAGTALMAAAAFRMAVLHPAVFDERYTAWASAKLQAVARHVDPQTGIAGPVVNSLRESQRLPLGGINPEAQAFVVLLYAAWRDWNNRTAEN